MVKGCLPAVLWCISRGGNLLLQEEGSKAANTETAQLVETPQAKTVGEMDVDMREAGIPSSSGAQNEDSASTSQAHGGAHTGKFDSMHYPQGACMDQMALLNHMICVLVRRQIIDKLHMS